MKAKLLSRTDVQRLLSMELAVEAVEAAFAAFARGESRMPSKVYLELPNDMGDFRAMPAYWQGAAGVKWVNSHPHNPSRHNLPAVMALYVLSDPETALPLAVLEATLLTAVRTGAAAAVASKHLARKPPRSLGLIGCGVQAGYILAAHRAVFGELETKVADRWPAAAERFALEHQAQAVSIETASGCDIVCTATPSRQPVVQRAWLRPGAHVNAMGADAPGKQELDPQILCDAAVFVDDLEQASESGEVNVPLHHGQLQRSHLNGILGEVILGEKRRRSVEQITVFDSTGLAIQDLALAHAIYDVANEQNVGTDFDF